MPAGGGGRETSLMNYNSGNNNNYIKLRYLQLHSTTNYHTCRRQKQGKQEEDVKERWRTADCRDGFPTVQCFCVDIRKRYSEKF